MTWHDGITKLQPRRNRMKSVIFFVDGHVGYSPIYYDSQKGPWEYNPPKNATAIRIKIIRKRAIFMLPSLHQ